MFLDSNDVMKHYIYNHWIEPRKDNSSS